MWALIRLFIIGVFSLMLNTFFAFAQSQARSRLNVNSVDQDKTYNLVGFAQGTSYSIRYYAPFLTVTKSDIDSIFDSINKSLSVYHPASTISLFNKSTVGITIDSHLKKVLKRSKKKYRISQGEFDPTIAPLLNLQTVGQVESRNPQNDIPLSIQLKDALNYVGYSNLKLKRNYLSKSSPKVQINLDGIAQGYSVDILFHFLKSKGLKSFLIELGGEIRVFGFKPDGEKYKISIDHPHDNALRVPIVSLKKGAITTSGSKHSNFLGNEKWITPQLNPKTGQPIESSILRATVYAKNAMDADAYDQIFYSKTVMESIYFAQRKLKIGLFIYYLDDQGIIQSIWNRRFQKILINSAQFKIYEN